MKNFKNIYIFIMCSMLLVSIPTTHVNAQAAQVVKSISKIFGKKAAKEVAEETAEQVAKEAAQGVAKKAGKEIAEETAEQAIKRLSKEAAETVIKKNATNALFQSSQVITKNVLSEVAPTAIKNTLFKQLSKELGENALKTTSKEFAQQVGKSASHEVGEQFIKRLGTESSQEALEHSAKQSMKEEAIQTSKTWIEKQKDLLRKVRLRFLNKVRKSKVYKDLLLIYKKGPIKLTDRELKELLANPQYFREYLKVKGGSKDVVEFLIRLKQSNPDHVRQLLANKEIKAYIKKSLRGKGGNHEWLMCENLEDFLLNPKWGKDGDLLACLLPRFSQATGKVRFLRGGGHISAPGMDATNSALFHNKLNDIIQSSNSTEELLVNIRRFAKKNLTPEDFLEFEKSLEKILA